MSQIWEPLPGLGSRPPSVTVRGPKEVLQNAIFIPTQAAPVDSRPGSPLRFPSRVPIAQEIDGKQVVSTPPFVGIRQPARPQKTYEITDVSVAFLCSPNLGLKPRFINDRDAKVSVRVADPFRITPVVYALWI